MIYSCPKPNSWQRQSEAVPLPSPGTRRAAQSSFPSENGARRRGRWRLKQGGPKNGPLCLPARAQGCVSHQLAKEENGKSGKLPPHAPHSPRLNCVPGPGPEKAQQNYIQLWPGRAAQLHPPQRCPAGDGRLQGRGRGRQRGAGRASGKLNELLPASSCLARRSPWGVCGDRRGPLPQKPKAPA